MSGKGERVSGLGIDAERVSGLSGLEPSLFNQDQPAHPLSERVCERDVSGIDGQPTHPLTSRNTQGERVERVGVLVKNTHNTHTYIGKQPEPLAQVAQPAHGDLRNWLGSLRSRGITVTVRDGAPTFAGEAWAATQHDRDQLARHRHALVLAAAGTHPDWWAYAAGLTDTWPDPDQLPLTCATCGGDVDRYDDRLLGWCLAHLPEPALWWAA